MKRYVLNDTFNIYNFETDVWEHPVHRHTYYEIIFILKGSGIHQINGNSYRYRRGDVFLLGPEDYHTFDIRIKTQFCYIRFNESFQQTAFRDNDKEWQKIVGIVLSTTYQSKGPIVLTKNEAKKLQQILDVLQDEYVNRHELHFGAMRDALMKSMIIILSRSLTRNAIPSTKAAPSSIEELLFYVRQNINNTSLLRISKLAEKFRYSPNYLSIHFKNQTGEALKRYIMRQKIKLVETRLLYSQHTLTEISEEFGFTDESHLCRQFRKYSGVSPGKFRKK